LYYIILIIATKNYHTLTFIKIINVSFYQKIKFKKMNKKQKNNLPIIVAQ
jgi:hypothetical protein